MMEDREKGLMGPGFWVAAGPNSSLRQIRGLQTAQPENKGFGIIFEVIC